MSLASGTSVGPYEIVGSLGSGGMGEVYRAHDPRLGRDVALKILPAATAGDPVALERFTREARALAALSHPHIVTIHSTEEADGVRFLTMELIEGRTLDKAIVERGVSPAQFFDVAMAMADALSAAHEKQILHRDLKPGNVMVTDSGPVKILDFGLARAEVVAAGDGDDATRSVLTGAGTVLGTTAYMSPEQVEGKPLDGRSDLFALGAVMYELLTGDRPFRGDSRLVDRCLEKNPRDRPRSAQEVFLELKALKSAWESSTGAVTQTAAAPHGNRARVVPVVAAALALAAAGYFALRFRTPGEISVSMKPLTNSGHVSSAAVSPDGRYVGYVESRDGKYAVFVQQVATGSSVQVMPPGDNDYFGLTFSPDSNYVYAAERRVFNLHKVASLGGAATTVMEDVRGTVTFAPNAAQFAFGSFDATSTIARLPVSGLAAVSRGARSVSQLVSATHTSSPWPGLAVHRNRRRSALERSNQ